MNMSIHELGQIGLRPDEVIVAATYYRDYIIAVSDRGTVYKIILEEL